MPRTSRRSGRAAFDGSIFTGMMTAMVGVLWAYDGWVNLTPLAEEVRDPGRNIPRALLLGHGGPDRALPGDDAGLPLVLPLPEVAAREHRPRGPRRPSPRVYCPQLLGEPGRRGDLDPRHVLDLHLAQRQRPDRPAGLFRDGPRRPLPRTPLPDPPDGSRPPPTPILAQGTWAILLTVAGTALIIVPAPARGGRGLPGRSWLAWAKLNKTPLYDLLYTYVIFGADALLHAGHRQRVRPPRPAARPAPPLPHLGLPGHPPALRRRRARAPGDMLRETPAESIAGLADHPAGTARLLESSPGETEDAGGPELSPNPRMDPPMDNPTSPARLRQDARPRGLGRGGLAGAAQVPTPPSSSGRRSRSPSRRSRPTEVDARMGLVLVPVRHLARRGRPQGGRRRESTAIVRRAEALRKFELDNGDGPFPVFTPYRAPLAGRRRSDRL